MKKIILLVMALSMVFGQAAFSADNLNNPAAIEKAKLNNTEWAISVKPSGEKGKVEADVISFVEGKMISKNMRNAGFNDAEVNVRIGEEGLVIWETMQSDGKGDFAFWRGDIENGKMKGMMTKEDKRGIISNFSFASK
jgi:hypothetical protein